MLDFIDLVAHDTPGADVPGAEGPPAGRDRRTLLDVLNDCRSAGSMKPLYAYRDLLPKLAEGELARVAKVDQLLDLLKLPRDSPPR
jgi:hypothetical protein